MFLSTMSCLWKSFGQCCQKTVTSQNTSQTQVRIRDSLNVPSSGTSHTLYTGSMCRTSSSMLTSSAWQVANAMKVMGAFIFPSSGGRSWTPCLLSHVSWCSRAGLAELFFFIFAEHKGKTLHLLKADSKPVPQERKRKKVGIYETFAAAKDQVYDPNYPRPSNSFKAQPEQQQQQQQQQHQSSFNNPGPNLIGNLGDRATLDETERKLAAA